jgi:hypothetical protein
MLHEGPGEAYASAAPVALVIADSADAAAEAVNALELAGCKARQPICFADAATDLSNYDGLDLILIETAAAPDALLEVVLARADTMARERSLGIVATVLPEQIDAAARAIARAARADPLPSCPCRADQRDRRRPMACPRRDGRRQP